MVTSYRHSRSWNQREHDWIVGASSLIVPLSYQSRWSLADANQAPPPSLGSWSWINVPHWWGRFRQVCGDGFSYRRTGLHCWVLANRSIETPSPLADSDRVLEGELEKLPTKGSVHSSVLLIGRWKSIGSHCLRLDWDLFFQTKGCITMHFKSYSKKKRRKFIGVSCFWSRPKCLDE